MQQIDVCILFKWFWPSTTFFEILRKMYFSKESFAYLSLKFFCHVVCISKTQWSWIPCATYNSLEKHSSSRSHNIKKQENRKVRWPQKSIVTLHNRDLRNSENHSVHQVHFTLNTFCMIWKDTIFTVISILNFFKSSSSQTFIKKQK